MEKAMFFLAMTGSSLYLLQQLGAFVRVLFSEQAKAVPVATKAPAAEEKKEPTLAGSTGVAERNKALIDLLTAQGQQLDKVTQALEQANARLAALEAPKPRAPRKPSVKPQSTQPEEGGYPPVQEAATGYEGMPPVIGGFEPVH